MICTRCQGTGFLNSEQIPDGIDVSDVGKVLEWVSTHKDHDVSVCDCCGNGETWYDVAGNHYNGDVRGADGPYAYNGGLCECN
jgi:hypothetical protein